MSQDPGRKMTCKKYTKNRYKKLYKRQNETNTRSSRSGTRQKEEFPALPRPRDTTAPSASITKPGKGTKAAEAASPPLPSSRWVMWVPPPPSPPQPAIPEPPLPQPQLPTPQPPLPQPQLPIPQPPIPQPIPQPQPPLPQPPSAVDEEASKKAEKARDRRRNYRRRRSAKLAAVKQQQQTRRSRRSSNRQNVAIRSYSMEAVEVQPAPPPTPNTTVHHHHYQQQQPTPGFFCPSAYAMPATAAGYMPPPSIPYPQMPGYPQYYPPGPGYYPFYR
ncbi:uncharacterized protein [Prorops nasuta]|uniref:uncharacterized protein n=1 Tax=Prorops nasuta TaxID=863751 RepID=UPI0034CDF5E7